MVQTYINLIGMLDSEMGKKQMSLFSHSEKAPWRVPLNSDYAKQNLGKLGKQLSFVFPVDFIYEEQDFTGQNHAFMSPIGVQWIKGKNDSIATIELRHVMKHNSKSNLSEGIEFLALAKLVELGFPGIVRKEAKEIRRNYGLIASVLGKLYFHETTIGRSSKSGDTPEGPADYPVIRVKKTDCNIQSIYHALREFYIMSLLVENRNIFPVIEWYNFRMFMILLPYIAGKSNDLLTNIGMAALEKHIGFFKKDADFSILFWDQIKEINVLIETHGYKLLLESQQFPMIPTMP